MGAAIVVSRLDYSASELRSLARSEAGLVACRIFAIAHVLEDASRLEAAALCGMDRQTLRDWVHRFNADAIEELANKASPGRSPALSDEQLAELRQSRPRSLDVDRCAIEARPRCFA